MIIFVSWTISMVMSLSCLFSAVDECQQTVDRYYSKPPIPIVSIENGLSNIDHLRAELIEAGLRYKESKTYKNGSVTEVWTYAHEELSFDYPINGEKYIPLIMVQISEWYTDMGIKWTNNVYVRIVNEYLPNYAEKFLSNVKSFYPLKEPFSIESTQGDKVSTEYHLRYSRKESNIYVEFDIDEYVGYEFNFYLDVL